MSCAGCKAPISSLAEVRKMVTEYSYLDGSIDVTIPSEGITARQEPGRALLAQWHYKHYKVEQKRLNRPATDPVVPTVYEATDPDFDSTRYGERAPYREQPSTGERLRPSTVLPNEQERN